MQYTIVHTIVTCEKNTRFLLKDDEDRYFSAKVPSGQYLEGDSVSDADVQIEEAKERWVEQYENSPGYPRKEMLDHLVEYKEKDMGCHTEVYIGDILERHILQSPEENLISDEHYGAALLESVSRLRCKGELRDDFRYMTSSQAFAVNFFTPLVKDRRLSALGPFCEDIDYNACDYEIVTDSEEETQFDFYIPGLEKRPCISVEVKYSENKFGEASGTDKQKWKYEHIYKMFLDNIASERVDEAEFYEFYQIWRNIIYHTKNPGQHICFLFPAFRSDLKKQVEFILSKCKEEVKPYVHVICSDSVVDSMIKEGGTLASYYKKFKRKYLDF